MTPRVEANGSFACNGPATSTRSRDRLFAYFALAFAIMAASWTALVFFRPEEEARTIVYAIRFVAFALILLAIVDKNRASR